MNAASLTKSERLQRVLNVLKCGRELSTRDIVVQADVCAVNSCVAELRENGHKIRCQRVGDRWYYKLLGGAV